MNHLTTIPTEISQLTNLTKLLLKTNKLTSLPQEFEQLTNLQMLNLYGNLFTKELNNMKLNGLVRKFMTKL